MLIRKLMPYVLLLGCIAIVLSLYFNLDASYISTINVNNKELQIFDIYKYLKNLENTFNTSPIDFFTILPTRTWVETIGGLDWFEELVNNLAFIFDWLYMPINLFLYPLRWCVWIIELLLSLLGWPVVEVIPATQTQPAGYTSTLITILEWVQKKMFIPYI